METQTKKVDIADLSSEEQLNLLRLAESKMAAQVESAMLEMLESDYDDRDWKVIWDESKCGRQEMLSAQSMDDHRNKARWLYWVGSEYMR